MRHSEDAQVFDEYCINYYSALIYLDALRKHDSFCYFEKVCTVRVCVSTSSAQQSAAREFLVSFAPADVSPLPFALQLAFWRRKGEERMRAISESSD